MVSEQPVKTPPEPVIDLDEAADAADQMLKATEKLRAKLPMMQGEPIPAQSTGD